MVPPLTIGKFFGAPTSVGVCYWIALLASTTYLQAHKTSPAIALYYPHPQLVCDPVCT